MRRIPWPALAVCGVVIGLALGRVLLEAPPAFAEGAKAKAAQKASARKKAKGPAEGQDTDPPYTLLDVDRVYYGDPYHFARPAVVSLERIFREIPAYRRIVDEGIVPDDARYWLLLDRANKRFEQVVRATALKHGFDLICEKNFLVAASGAAPPIDLTRKVLEELAG